MNLIKKILIGIGILAGIGITVYFVVGLIILIAFGAFDKDYSVSELKDNFYSHEVEIRELKRYYNSIVPPNKFIEIEFRDDKTTGRFGIYDTETETVTQFLGWDIEIAGNTMDSLLNTIGWTRNQIIELKKKLDTANCIGIKSGEPATIGFKRCRFGMYSFNVFDEAIPDSLKSSYNDGCTYRLAGEKLVLEYGGGAVGPQCFYNLK
jgi:hypothetical protein